MDLVHRGTRTWLRDFAAVVLATAALTTALGGPELLDRIFGPVPPAVEALNTVRTAPAPPDATSAPIISIRGDATEFVQEAGNG